MLLAQVVEALRLGREVFPLSPIPAPPFPHSRGRRSRQRFHRAHRLWELAENSRVTLSNVGAPACQDVVTAVSYRRVRRGDQHRCTTIWLTILRECKRVIAARRASCQRLPTGAALTEYMMRHSGADLYTSNLMGAYVPFVGRLMAEPPPDHPAVPLLRALPEDIGSQYLDVRRLIKPDDQIPSDFQLIQKRYRRVLGQRSEWVKYLHRRDIRPLWRLVPAEEVKLYMGIGAVPKKDTDALDVCSV